MAKKGTAKAKTVKPVEKELEVNEFSQETVIQEAPKEVAPIKEKESKEPKKEWVKDFRELLEVEGTNQTQEGREYYGVKRKS